MRQQPVDLPTFDGVHPVLGCWIVGDAAAGMGVREDASLITTGASQFVPHMTRDIHSIVGCLYSMSSSARPLFGDDAQAFEAELSRALLGLNPAGVFHENIETEVVIAPKRAR